MRGEGLGRVGPARAVEVGGRGHQHPRVVGQPARDQRRILQVRDADGHVDLLRLLLHDLDMLRVSVSRRVLRCSSQRRRWRKTW